MIPRTLLLLALLFLGRTPSFSAATNGVPALQPERWLLVVDISSPMKNRAPAVRDTVADLLASGMQGQLADGHELGLWTFNDQLHTELDAFTWDATRTNEIIQSMTGFLEKQKYSRKPEFSETLTNLQSLVRDSRRLTVILFSDGDEAIRGTPYDEAILEFFQSNGAEARAGKVPLITILRGGRGQWIGRSQSYSPWPVVFPTFPAEPLPPATATNVAAAVSPTSNAPPAPQPRVVIAEPLIVRGPDPLSKEIKERGLDTNTASGNLVVQKPPQPAPPEEPPTNEVAATEKTAAAAPVLPPPTAEPPPAGDAPHLRWSWTVLGLGLLVLTVVTTLILRQRRSARGHASLITRSMNGTRTPPDGSGNDREV